MKINFQKRQNPSFLILLTLSLHAVEVINTPTMHRRCGCAQAYATLLLD